MSTILSLDIGTKNFGYALISKSSLKFGVFAIGSNIKKRYDILSDFLTKVIKENNVEYVVIEKQVNVNTVGMCIMYMLFSICSTILDSSHVDLFVPLQKFKVLKLPYNTYRKQHKKQSIEYARNLISHRYPTEIQEFDKLCKKDDVADAFNQGIIWIFTKRLWDDLDTDTLRGQFLEENESEKTKEKEEGKSEKEINEKEDNISNEKTSNYKKCMEETVIKSIIKNDNILIVQIKDNNDPFALLKKLVKNKIKIGKFNFEDNKLCFTINKENRAKLEKLLDKECGYTSIKTVTKISLVGSGISNHLEILETVLKTLEEIKSSIIDIDVSACKISILFNSIIDIRYLNNMHNNLLEKK